MAAGVPGASVNDIIGAKVDPVSGVAVVTGVPVVVERRPNAEATA